MRELWPHFELPSVPREGPVAKISAFAEALGPTTNGAVVAVVLPVPQDIDSSESLFNFVLRVAQRPNIQTVLFSLSQTPEGTQIGGWAEPQLLKTDDELVAFLAKVANSPDTRVRIQRLLLSAEAMLDE